MGEKRDHKRWVHGFENYGFNKYVALIPIVYLVLGSFMCSYWSRIVEFSGTMGTVELDIGFRTVTCWDNEPTKLRPKDVAEVSCELKEPETNPNTNKTAHNKMIANITNAYPSYEAYCNLTIDNTGTISAVIRNVTVTAPPELNVWLAPNLTNTQVDSCNSIECTIRMHLKHNVLERHTYTFEIDIACEDMDALWSEVIKINGVVKTGSMTGGLTRIVAEWDKEDWLDYYGLNPEGKDVGETFCWLDLPIETDVHTNKTVYKKLWCVVNNSYGDYWGINKFTIDNAGTIPVIIDYIDISYDPAVLSVIELIPDMVWEFTDIGTNKTAFNVWLYKEPPNYGPGWEIDPPWMFPAPYPHKLVDNQIDPQPEFVSSPWPNMTASELLTELCVHVKQSAPMCHTWYFDIEIGFRNWDDPHWIDMIKVNGIVSTSTFEITPVSNLLISSPYISFSDSNPSEGQIVTVSATVHNSGEGNAENITVRFFDATKLIGEEQISFISHYSHGTASIDWTAESEGYHLIKVVVDPNNNINETNEDDNIATRSILVGEIPYFGGIVVNGSVTPNETRTGCSTIVEGYAEYNTTYGAGEPVAGAEVTVTIVGLEQETTHTIKDGTYEVNITAPYAPGNYTIVITVTDYTFWESIEIGLNVSQEEGVDLTLSHHDIFFLPSNPIEKENVEITATIHNVGTDNATNVLVAFYDDGEPTGNRTIDLIPGGGSEDTMISWNATPWGWHTITVVIDPENTTGDIHRENNEASKNVYVYPSLPDLTPTHIDFSDATPVVNQTITISANVRNIGGVGASNVLVSFYDGDQSIGNTTIFWIPGKGESRTASITYSFMISGWHTINATVDVVKNITEADENNNWHRRSIYVHLPSPDLAISSSDIRFSDSTPAVGDIITIYATIHNVGETDAYNVTVEFFDWSSPIGLPIIISSIRVTEEETVEVQWNATPPKWHRIKVIVDANNSISEPNENNNVASRYIHVIAPDLCIISEDIVFSDTNPDQGENVTIYAIVHNIGDAGAQNLAVLFYVDDDPLGVPQIIPFIAVSKNETVSTTWNATGLGSHVVKVEIEYTKLEYSEDNNVATRAIIVGKHDVAVIDVIPSETKVYEGNVININVTARNEGTVSDSFNVTAFFDGNIIQIQTNVTLNPGIETTLTFSWNTSGVPGNHRISSEASIVPGEIDTSDNTFVNGIVKVVTRLVEPIPGDGNATIEGNVTITKALIRKNVLHFDASGPSGSIGWINVTFPMINTTEIKVFIDGGPPLDPPPFPVITKNETHYFIYFEFNLSTHEIDIQYAVADIAITNVTSSKTIVGEGCPLNINVTIQNQGDNDETFNVTAYYDETAMILLTGKNYTTVTLSSGNSTTVTLTWNATGVAKGNYTISAYAYTIPFETDTDDNTYTDGKVLVTIAGDVNGDGVVDIFDLSIVGMSYGKRVGQPGYNPYADITEDGFVDARDLAVVCYYYGETDP